MGTVSLFVAIDCLPMLVCHVVNEPSSQLGEVEIRLHHHIDVVDIPNIHRSFLYIQGRWVGLGDFWLPSTDGPIRSPKLGPRPTSGCRDLDCPLQVVKVDFHQVGRCQGRVPSQQLRVGNLHGTKIVSFSNFW